MMTPFTSTCLPPLDPGFISAALWHRWFETRAHASGKAAPVTLHLCRPDGSRTRRVLTLLEDTPTNHTLNLRALERTLKFMLWQQGGNEVFIDGADSLVGEMSRMYSPDGTREFDSALMGDKIFGAPFRVSPGTPGEASAAPSHAAAIGGYTNGCRVGFDLGGSDRKCAALIDGELVYSEEIAWNPYFQSDVSYHYQGIMDSIRRAAERLPRVDAIGGSAAGVYINNRVKIASLFRGIPEHQFKSDVEPIFLKIAAEWGVPFEVINDGEVTALAGSMAGNSGALLGLAMGTSEAVGYCDAERKITNWLNELAFAPIDYREDAPEDEWSGDHGCGVQYLSQQAVGRLLPAAGIPVEPDTPLPERLVFVQDLMRQNDPRAERVYETIGCYLGHAAAHYASFYDLRQIMLLGRVMSGPGGDIIIKQATDCLKLDFPDLAEHITFTVPDEQTRRHGQAAAAATLPFLPE
ncbi:MAG: ROK family protein [Lentisphaeria bacterium]|nr:ROK family protein [Lentisphaeria bacterium]